MSFFGCRNGAFWWDVNVREDVEDVVVVVDGDDDTVDVVEEEAKLLVVNC